MCIYIYIYMYNSLYSVYVCMYVCTYVCICIYIYIHTHTRAWQMCSSCVFSWSMSGMSEYTIWDQASGPRPRTYTQFRSQELPRRA